MGGGWLLVDGSSFGEDVLGSSFVVLRSSFFVLRSSFFVLRSLFVVRCSSFVVPGLRLPPRLKMISSSAVPLRALRGSTGCLDRLRKPLRRSRRGAPRRSRPGWPPRTPPSPPASLPRKAGGEGSQVGLIKAVGSLHDIRYGEAFFVLRSSFFVLRSSFFVLRSLFFVRCSWPPPSPPTIPSSAVPLRVLRGSPGCLDRLRKSSRRPLRGGVLG